MEISPAALSPPALWLGHALMWPLVALAARGIGWRALLGGPAGHRFLGFTVAILVLWQIRAVVPPLPAMHLLGATFLTLMFGWRPALMALTAILLATSLADLASLRSLGLNGLISCALPVLITASAVRLLERTVSENPFSFILLGGFAVGAAAMATVGIASTAVLLGASNGNPAHVVDLYLGAYMLLPFAEGFVTGGALAWLVAYYPDWVNGYEPRLGARR